jgi:alpha-D-ribose 1-methylphosphonate 5-triphosphate synthase subunit PhnH
VTAPLLTPRAAREQRTFRTLLDSMARPGSLGRLSPAGQAEQNPLLAVAEALVDHEVTFAVLPQEGVLTEQILRSTGSRVAAVEEADYVFCDVSSLAEALRSSKEGSPEFPDEGATVICSVWSLSEDRQTGMRAYGHAGTPADGPACVRADGKPGRRLALSGPGIQETARIEVDGFAAEALAVFVERNAAPPLGLDLVLVDPDGSVVSLGRYTRIQEE